MDPKKLAGLSEDEVVAELSKNPTEARQLAALMVGTAAIVVRAGRMKSRTDDQIFGDVVGTLAKAPEIDVTTPEGIAVAIVVAEYAVRLG